MSLFDTLFLLAQASAEKPSSGGIFSVPNFFFALIGACILMVIIGAICDHRAARDEDDDEEENEADTDVTEQQSNEEVTTKNDGQVETDEAYAHALQHHFDDEQSRQSRQEKGDAALALVLQNEDSPHAREISSSTNPSETFEFKDPQQVVDEQCGDAEVAAMALEEEDEDMTEEVAMEALVDPRSDDDDDDDDDDEEEEAPEEEMEGERR